MPNSKWAAPTGSPQDQQHCTTESSHHGAALKPRAKKLRLLDALLTGPKTSFELEKAPVFDHCANSTVSEWRKQGIDIRTEMVTVAGYGGEPAHIARYSLAPKAIEQATRLTRMFVSRHESL
ncbi:MAG TPA: helix-turn-helix domain-containing protein [Povalibacter sp.]|uniref:helix-turn-helix domain-containing protein n=1 Tax=Povalibacter sp. TaxID=1962978 RepID=UPI002BFE5104|nr:helix-turn-helix domain-containing protein [Povalibacter sp.]HMN42944.1 helix-turn-helix domain-containing protein [Povalibacter sp.]